MTTRAERRRRRRQRRRSRHHRQGDQARRLVPVQRAGVGLRDHRHGRQGLLQVPERQGRRQRPQDRLHHARRRLRAAEGAPERAPARPAGEGLRDVQHAGHAEQPRDLGLPQRAEGPAAVRRHRRVGLGQRRQGAPVHDRLAAELRDRGQGLRGLPEGGEAEGQGRGALPERRLRQGPAQRLQAGHRRQRHQDREAGELQRHRPDRRRPGRPARALGRGHVPEHHDAEVRGAGDRDRRQERLEAAAHPQQRGADKNLVLKPVGLENAKGIVSTAYFKDPQDRGVGRRSGGQGVP